MLDVNFDQKTDRIFIYLLIVNCNWVDTRWQQYSTHLHTNSAQNTQNGTYTIKRKKFGKCRPCPVFASYTLAFALQLKKKKARKKPQLG
jgi:hypothetical protein